MYFKVDKTGCSIRKGMVQIRYCLYLDRDDYGYDKHYVEVPIIPPEGYTGKFDEFGSPVDQKDYNTWLASLPTQMQLNPFHNHFIQVDPTITDEEIKYVGELALQAAKEKWEKDERPDVKNIPVNYPKIVTPERLEDCQTKVAYLQTAVIDNKVLDTKAVE